jgi:hypothetical protein
MTMIFKHIRKRLKVFSILSSAILLLPTPTSIHACGLGSVDQEEGRFMLFNPDLRENKAWWSFFYNNKILYMNGEVCSNTDELLLTREWVEQLKLRADEASVKEGLFGSLPDSALVSNKFYSEIQDHQAAKEYFEIARKCESLASFPAPWDNAQENVAKQKDRKSILAVIEHALEKNDDQFFKKRYAFQLAKMSFYDDDSVMFNKVYNKYFGSSKMSVLDWWALHYKSMMLERAGQVDSANYLHALVFSHSSNKMLASRQFFSRKDLEKVLALAQHDNDRADIYLLSETINPGRSLDGILSVYRYAPSHQHLPLLIGREINKLEDWLGSTRYANLPRITDDIGQPVMTNWQHDFQYLKQFTQALAGMRLLEANHPVFYNLSMTYLSLMQGDAHVAKKYLDRVDSEQPAIQYQVQILKTVHMVETSDISKAAVQDEIGRMLESLIDTRAQKFESQKMLYSLCSYLRYNFAKKGMVWLAGLFDNYAVNKFCYDCDYSSLEYSLIRYFDKYASVNDVHKLIDVYDKAQKNKLEEVLMRPYANKYFFYDALSVKYLRQNDVKNAVTALKNVPDEFWFSYSNAIENIGRDPFLDNEALLAIQTMITYNKREIVEKMYDLEMEAMRVPAKRSQNYFLLANAWYNFSEHSWFMISYGLTESTTLDPQHAINARSTALKYYHKALKEESETENKVKLVYMIALLSDQQAQKQYAREYERYSNSAFYAKRNCLTLYDLARK